MSEQETTPSTEELFPTMKKYASLTVEARNQIEAKLDRLLRSPNGLAKTAEKMLSPLKSSLMYEGRIRQIFQVYTLSQGEAAEFDADVDVPAAALSINGNPVMLDTHADRIRVETSPIASRPSIRMSELNYRKYDVLKRTMERAKNSIVWQEDSRGYRLLSFAASLSGQPTLSMFEGTSAANSNPSLATSTSVLDIRVLAQQIGELRGKLLEPGHIWMHPTRASNDLVLFNTTTSGTGGIGVFAPARQEELLNRGIAGEFFGIKVLHSPVVPAAEVYVLAQPEYLGVMAIRSEIDSLQIPDPDTIAQKMVFWEEVGFLCRYIRGISKITVA